MANRLWTEQERLVALDLYCRLPYGQFNKTTPEIMSVAARLNRTPDALAMKLSNLAAFDPVHQSRGVKGLANGAKSDEALMKEFIAHPHVIIEAASQAIQNLLFETSVKESDLPLRDFPFPDGPTEKTRSIPVRIVQRFFRNAVLSSYEFRCAFCLLDVPELLNASHIVPWKTDESQRANPCNGIALCTLHDRAFDRGLMTLSPSMQIVLSSQVKREGLNPVWLAAFGELRGKELNPPLRFAPDPKSLIYHNEHIFRG